MYKKIFIILFLLFAGCSAFTEEKALIFSGFQNLEKKQKLNIINKIQAVADNDDIEFSKLWPNDYFENENIYSYIYFAKNNLNTLRLIKFDIAKSGENCLTQDNNDFCVPKIAPTIALYRYNNKLVEEITPDFIKYPKDRNVYEIFIKKDNSYNKEPVFSSVQKEPNENLNTVCTYDEKTAVKFCKTYTKEDYKLKYTEKLILRNKKEGISENNALKYIKYNSDDKKIEEYIYNSGKHIFYDEQGEITEFCQYGNNKFKYYNTKLPDLYIDADFITDNSGQIIEERYNERNHNAIRKYRADYQNGKISKIHVYDMYNTADWEIIPTKKQNISLPDFKIRQ